MNMNFAELNHLNKISNKIAKRSGMGTPFPTNENGEAVSNNHDFAKTKNRLLERLVGACVSHI